MPITKNQARQNLHELVETYYRLGEDGKKNVSESAVLGQFVDPLFRDVLGWPTKDSTIYRHEQPAVRRRRVDRVLNLEGDIQIYIEAKRFGLIERLSYSNEWSMGPGQLTLPSMAVDRSREEQQAINYAFENGGKWAILCNFECLRLFNARRDWLLLAFETPAAYKDDFELLQQLSWENINRGSLERLNDQRVVKDLDSDYLDFINEQREALATDITLNREQNAWAYPQGKLDIRRLRSAVQRFLDRLVVIRFAEDHYVIDSRPLWKAYENCKGNPYAGGLQTQLSFVFRSFDQLHNSALFAESEADQAYFSDEVLFPLMEKLYEARFRAMPADIIGNTYEQYLGKTLVEAAGSISIQDNLETRKAQGSYYTPQYIVQFIVDHTLGRYLYATENGRHDGIAIPGQARKTSAEIRDLRVLDNACGSGSFLIYAYQVLAEFYQAEALRLEEVYRQQTRDLSFLDILPEVRQIQAEGLYVRDNYRRLILEKHIYGVDLDPQAAEIAVMNLILRALEGSKASSTLTLPLILNQNIKVGNALIGLAPDDTRLADHAEDLAAIRRLRSELLDADHRDPRHDDIQAELEARVTRLRRLFQGDFHAFEKPFHWPIEFPEVYYDDKGQLLEDPGFTFIFGNPPYGAKLSTEERKYFKRTYDIGMSNTAGLFMAHSAQELRIARGGGVGLIVPKSFLYASNWRKLREQLLDGIEIVADVGRGWDEVLLEQVIYIQRKGAQNPSYCNMKRDGLWFSNVSKVEKDDCRQFGFIANGISETELKVAKQVRSSNLLLGDFIRNRRGAGLQKHLKQNKRGKSVLAGSSIQRYHINSRKGYYDSNHIPENASIRAGGILAQNIVTRLQNPVPHIRIVSYLVQKTDAADFIILDTVNQITVTSENLSPHLLLALLNGKLLNWYVYRFIYAKAALTMHFDKPITDRIPLPNFSAQPELVEKIIAEVKKIYANRQANEQASQARIDDYIFQLYGLSAAQIELVDAGMP